MSIMSRFVNARAIRTLHELASSPVFINRTMSAFGTMAQTLLASSSSIGLAMLKRTPFDICSRTAASTSS